jgi:hypothetical protein
VVVHNNYFDPTAIWHIRPGKSSFIHGFYAEVPSKVNAPQACSNAAINFLTPRFPWGR